MLVTIMQIKDLANCGLRGQASANKVGMKKISSAVKRDF